MGRNIWQSDNPVPMIRAVRSIIHGNADADSAWDLYQRLAASGKDQDEGS